MAPRRNPLTDELTGEAKAELAAVFAEMKRHYGPLIVHEYDRPHTRRVRRQFWERTGS